jgi:UDP-GlcNAc:undecaprenyl-phosphate GlcNAc-1-phosphate transferase
MIALAQVAPGVSTSLLIWVVLGAVALSAGLAAVFTPISRRVARKLGMVDRPERHKAHKTPTPLLGGSAIFAAILVPSLAAVALASYWARAGAPLGLPGQLAVHVSGAAERAPMALVILAGAMLLHIVGLLDDRKALGPWSKLAAQLAAAGLVVGVCGLRVLEFAGEPVSAIATVVWIVAITNAFNFLDNMDGLAAGVAAICAGALLAAAAGIGQMFVAGWACLILGALLGFLPYNFPPARTFMGDAGSLVVGYLLAVVSVLTTYVRPGETYYLYGVFVPLVVMAVPLYDMVSVVTLRLRERRHPMVGDRRHFSHRLQARGMSTRKTVGTIWLCTGATAIGAMLLTRTTAAGAVLVAVQTVAILAIIALLESSADGGRR